MYILSKILKCVLMNQQLNGGNGVGLFDWVRYDLKL